MSRGQDGDEPIFIRSNWGTSRYVYNPRNPVGMGLILFEVTAKDVDAAFCLSVSPPEPEAVLTSIEVSLSVTVEEGRC
ncbi:hypothetical protein ACFWRZ_19615 [Streptomyces rubiginosohelvolus]|uniref:hypothetical protein n=1 Tax=Streptomyces rubiginosohelvolus TaxID=67362 RepID=UPI003657DEA5